MKYSKGLEIRTAGKAIWYIKETQRTNDYLKVVSKDGFETIIDVETITYIGR